jgi:hypothetical protein
MAPMDSLIVEALVETTRALEDMQGLATAAKLRERRDALERVASTVELRTTPRDQLLLLTRLVVELRDETLALRNDHRVVREAVADAID